MMWDTVIGLEVHAQLKTHSKLFSGSSTNFGQNPNTQTSFIDAGLPGVLPVLNRQAVVMAIQFGLAVNATINHHCYFERKNYFYPDLPKGYQISQFQQPIVKDGILHMVMSNGVTKTVTIQRAHLEEDAGKSIHDRFNTYSGIDLNRAGTPLLEIVTTPCLYSAEEAVNYLKTLHQLVRFLGICDGNMQEGSFRCDVNISLKPQGTPQLGTRTELKNLNSFRFIEQAILYEQARHQELLENGKTIIQETRLFNPDTQITEVLRSKENENDYRYFPDPDLLPLEITQEELAAIQQTMPLLPAAIKQQLQACGNLLDDDVQFILSSPAIWQFFSEINAQSKADEKMIINWLKSTYAAALKESNISFDNPPVTAEAITSLLDYLHEQAFSHTIAKRIFSQLWQGEKDINAIIEREGYLNKQDDAVLEGIVQTIIQAHPEQAAELRAGKDKLLGFFVGRIMKQTQGQANPERIHALLKKYL